MCWLDNFRLISEEGKDALRGGDPIQALVVESAQLTYGAEDLVPQQEDDEQATDANVPLHGPQGANCQSHSGSPDNGQVHHSGAPQVHRQDPHGGPVQGLGLLGNLLSPRLPAREGF